MEATFAQVLAEPFYSLLGERLVARDAGCLRWQLSSCGFPKQKLLFLEG